MLLSISATSCANVDCGELELSGALIAGTVTYLAGNPRFNPEVELDRWSLRPRSNEKPQPAIVPAPLVEDYVEACRIRDLSPKASATLARRCLQGMIRDFCGIAKPTLLKEIEALNKVVEAGTAPPGVTAETVEAIDHVRSIGNIGAHMEKDIDVIVPVEPGEAQALIELIELLFEEWYVARHSRQEKLARVRLIAAEKAFAKASETGS
ncbi:DUF4145 domain-containing protein [Brevundimonas sp. NPDC046655]|uniref:DUF4145 domain-containing protein n=1 Tax=unclassified Brevundimonas TaxID=2622653 RepID=UPI00384AF034